MNALVLRDAPSTRSAKVIREELKASGFKGRQLTVRVNETLKAESGDRNAICRLAIDQLIDQGFVFDEGQINKAGNKVKVQLVKPGAGSREQVARLEEENRALRARLDALESKSKSLPA